MPAITAPSTDGGVRSPSPRAAVSIAPLRTAGLPRRVSVPSAGDAELRWGRGELYIELARTRCHR